jgi:hypothetical protein
VPSQLVSDGRGWRAGSTDLGRQGMAGRVKMVHAGPGRPGINREGDGLPVPEGGGESRLQRVCKVVKTEL